MNAQDWKMTGLTLTGDMLDAVAPQGSLFRAISYRSRKGDLLDAHELTRLVESARLSNRKHGITGLLVLAEGDFFQWFEGPADAVERLWALIQNDSRHFDVELLSRGDLPMRSFSNWDMQLGWREGDEAPADIESCVAVPAPWLAAMRERAAPVADLWRRLGVGPRQQSEFVSDVRANAMHRTEHRPSAAAPATDIKTSITIDDATDVMAEMIQRLLANDPGAADEFVAALHALGLSSESLYLDLFEPVSRRLGDLWAEDACTDFDVTLGLCRLQSLVRQLGRTLQQVGKSPVRRRVLLATQPGEQHMLALALSSEYFWRADWDVTLAFPKSNDELTGLLSGQHFDVLDLSLSTSFRRDHWLQRMSDSVQDARGASRNRRLVVLVCGRVFLERPEFGLVVGADGCYGTASRAVPLAGCLVNAMLDRHFERTQQVLRDLGVMVGRKAFRTAAMGNA
jgi:hypothetical protein